MDNGSCSPLISSSGEQITALHSVPWGIPLFVVLNLCSAATLVMFFHSFHRVRRTVAAGNSRIFLIRLFALFPVYSVTSLAGLYIPKGSIMANWGASLYLASTLYTFVLLVVEYYGGMEKMKQRIEGVTVSLSAPPFTCCCPCLPHAKFSETNFHRMRALVLQAAYIRPLAVFLSAILWADGLFNPSVIAPDSAYIYLTLVGLLSSLIAVFGLSLIYNATREQLQQYMIGAKFNTVKIVLIMTNAQNLVIAVLIKANVIPCVGPLDSASRGEVLYNILVIFEMFLMNLILKIYYWRWSSSRQYGEKEDIGDIEKKAPTAYDNEIELHEHTENNGTASNVANDEEIKSEAVLA